MKLLHAVIVSLGLATATVVGASPGDLRSVAGMQFHYNALIVFTPSLADARLKAQSGVMAKLAVAAARRDLLFIQVDPAEVIGANDKPATLRHRFDVAASAYRTVLIGKSGQVVLSARGPVGGAAIVRAIDAASARGAAAHARAGSPAAR